MADVPTSVTESAPTESHALATAGQEEVGAAQAEHEEPEVKDLGWNKPSPAPLVGGLPNDELWTLVRRFNRQMYHVKATDEDPPGGLDLNVADEDGFSPDKLRSNIERVYMTVIVGLSSFAKHIARLRSWNEFRRTAAFLLVYYLAWFMDLLTTLFCLLIIILIIYPPSRKLLFPPAPLSLVDAKSGALKKPAAGVLGSHGSLTGALEKHEGEAVEQEAHNFVSSFGVIAIRSAAGKHPGNRLQEEESAAEKSMPDPADVVMGIADAKQTVGGVPVGKGETHDKTKEPVVEAMWEKTGLAMHVLGDIADAWERFANALSPTPPFPRYTPCLKPAALLVPALLASLFTPAYTIVKSITFVLGLAFFGDPIISRIIPLLNRKFPGWQQLLQLRNTILKGIPTNAQLAITLLRIGESHRAPLPPPPRQGSPPSNAPAPIPEFSVPPEISTADVTSAASPEEPQAQKQHPQPPPKKPLAKRLVGFLKGAAKTSVSTALTANKLKASAGSERAKNRLGILTLEPDDSGPVEFVGRYKGKKGIIYVVKNVDRPFICFTEKKYSPGKGMDIDNVEFSVAIDDIREVRKVGGLGWKSKLVVGWAMDQKLADGLDIVDSRGVSRTLTAIPLREELFNRLVAMGPQKWESW